jgi:hypothetical protein
MRLRRRCKIKVDRRHGEASPVFPVFVIEWQFVQFFKNGGMKKDGGTAG